MATISFTKNPDIAAAITSFSKNVEFTTGNVLGQTKNESAATAGTNPRARSKNPPVAATIRLLSKNVLS